MNRRRMKTTSNDVNKMVEIRVMIDPSKGSSSDKTNFNVKTFPSIKNLMGAGLEVLKLCSSLNINVFKPEGLVDPYPLRRG